MPFRVEARVEGLTGLIRKLDDVKKSLRTKYLRAAMRASVSVVNKGAKANLQLGPDATGQTKRSLGVKVKVYPSGIVIGVVEPRGGFRIMVRIRRSSGWGAGGGLSQTRYHDPVKTAHLIEKGTKIRMTKKGYNRGSMKPRPFLFPAFAANESKIIAIFEDKIDEALAEIAAK